jgi:parvulin-like peptidyl-prolyl isomerase
LKEETAPEPTVSADAGDAASAPTATAAPPTATPDAPTAVTQFNKIIDALFLAYTNGLTAQGLTPKLNKEDFSVALRKQYSRQVLTNGVKEKLVPAESFTASDQPTGYETSQIFVRVDVPEGTADAERDALFAAKRAEADALLQRVQSGEDFAEVAASASDYATNLQHNGKMDVFDATGKSVAGTQFEQSYVDATLSLQVGEVYAEPVRTTFGWHIIKLDTVRLPSFDEQLATARGDAFEEWFAALSDKLAVGYAVAPTATVIPEATQAAPLLPTAALGGYPTDVPASEPPPATPTTTPTPKP